MSEPLDRTDLAVLKNLCREHALPPPDGRLLGRNRGLVRAALPLLQARGLWDRRIDRRPPSVLVKLVDAVRADPSLDIRLVPAAVYWGRAPRKDRS